MSSSPSSAAPRKHGGTPTPAPSAPAAPAFAPFTPASSAQSGPIIDLCHDSSNDDDGDDDGDGDVRAIPPPAAAAADQLQGSLAASGGGGGGAGRPSSSSSSADRRGVSGAAGRAGSSSAAAGAAGAANDDDAGDDSDVIEIDTDADEADEEGRAGADGPCKPATAAEQAEAMQDGDDYVDGSAVSEPEEEKVPVQVPAVPSVAPGAVAGTAAAAAEGDGTTRSTAAPSSATPASAAAAAAAPAGNHGGHNAGSNDHGNGNLEGNGVTAINHANVNRGDAANDNNNINSVAEEVVDEEEQLRQVLALSMQTAQRESEARARYQEAVAALSPAPRAARDAAASNGVDAADGAEDDGDEIQILPMGRRTLTRREFKSVIESIISENGGWDKIERGNLVKAGNMDFRRRDIAEGGGRAQSRAQYGRYTVEGYWRLMDVLEGRADMEIVDEEDDEEGSNVEGGDNVNQGAEEDLDVKPPARAAAAANDTATPSSSGDEKENDSRNDKLQSPSRKGRKRRLDNTLPGAKPITAHVDIGHGIGVQVLQAYLGLGIPSRGVEIMKGRQLIATQLMEGVVSALRRDPPDMSRIEMRCDDFSKAVLPDARTGRRDEELRTFLLCRDLSEEEQRGLVIFVNNAREIFAARSNNNKAAPLDCHLAELFGNMKVGGRLVTLEDITCHLQQNTNWFRRDVFQSGAEAVTWGGRSVEVYVLTKLRDDWTCQNEECESVVNFGGDGAASNVVDENGRLSSSCVYCGGGPKRTFRKRVKKRKYDA